MTTKNGNDQGPTGWKNYQDSELQAAQLAPHNIEAEEAVLGAVLIHDEAIHELKSVITPDDFFIVRHAWIWEAMIILHQRGDPIDILTVIDELEQSERLAEVGGRGYIITLSNKTPSALNAEGYGRIVERMNIRRRLIDAAGQIARVAHSDETDIETVVAQAEDAIISVTRSVGRRNVNVTSALDLHLFELDRQTEIARKLRDGESIAITTGFPLLDKIMGGGTQRKELVTWIARTNVGKSLSMKQRALAAILAGYRVGVITLEMPSDQWVRRVWAQHFNINANRLKWGEMGTEEGGEAERLAAGLEEVSQWPLFVIGSTPNSRNTKESGGAQTWAEVKAGFNLLVQEYECDLILIDFIQDISEIRSEGEELRSKNEQFTHASSWFKIAAKKYNIGVDIAAQVNRNGLGLRDSRPTTGQIAHCDGIGQKSDWVIGIHDPGETDATFRATNPHDREVGIVKGRDGEKGWFPHKFDIDGLYFKPAIKVSTAIDPYHDNFDDLPRVHGRDN